MTTHTRCPNCHALIADGQDQCPNCEQAFCPACQAPINQDDTACERCGAEFALFCEFCDGEVAPDAAVCPHCGQLLEEEGTAVLSQQPSKLIQTESDLADSEPEEAFTGQCPACQTPLFIEDGFCPACGATLCGRCGQLVDEEDETCPHCQTPLFFDCPVCHFELTAGTDICPNCNTLFPAFCSRCRTSLQPGTTACPTCQQPVQPDQRTTARVLHAFLVDQALVRIVACPSCGAHFNPAEDNCPGCAHLICAGCQIKLAANEQYCPRCGVANKLEQQSICPHCRHPIAAGSDECPHCHQLLCPACQAAVAEDDLACPQCGAEFELVCPACETAVTAEVEICPTCGESL